MSVVEDVRKIVQDLVSPDLKALVVRVDAIEKRMEANNQSLERRVDAVEKRIEANHQALEKRMDAIEKRMEANQQAVEKKMEANQQEVLSAIRALADYNSLAQRVSKIETRQESSN